MRTRVTRALVGLYVALILSVFIGEIWRRWKDTGIGSLQLSLPKLFISVTGMIGLIIIMALLWRRLLVLLSKGQTIYPYRPIFRIHVFAWLGRYLPGKIGSALGKIVLSNHIPVTKPVIISSVAYENVLFIASGLSLTALTIGPTALEGVTTVKISAYGAAIFVAAIVFLSVFLIRAGLFMMTRVAPELARGLVDLTVSQTIVLFLLYHLAHIAAGAGFYVLLQALGMQHDVSIVTAIGVLTAAHIAGILALFAPAGIGVREAALVMLLTPYLGVDQAILGAAATRIWSVAADALVLLFLPFLPRLNQPVTA